MCLFVWIYMRILLVKVIAFGLKVTVVNTVHTVRRFPKKKKKDNCLNKDFFLIASKVTIKK